MREADAGWSGAHIGLSLSDGHRDGAASRVPFDGAAEAVIERHFGPETELALGAGDIQTATGLAIPDRSHSGR